MNPPQPDGGAARGLDRLGIPVPLAWGYLGLLVFMIGNGIESGYLSPYLASRGVPEGDVAWIFTVYGLTAAAAAWFSGALSDLWGPHRVMWIGLLVWMVFHAAFMVWGIAPADYRMLLVTYALRGFGYPLFAFGFLVWITAATPPARLSTAAGWFWFAFTGGMPTLGSLVASYTAPWIGPVATLWCALALVAAGGAIALFGLREPRGRERLAPAGERVIATLLSGVSIGWRNPKVGAGCIVRTINTASQFGFFVFLPAYLTATIGFSLSQWLRLLSFMFLSNIFWNLLFGIIGDRFGWRRTVALFGGMGCAVSTLLLYYVPAATGGNYAAAVLAAMLYGATLAAYVPLSVLMPSLAPEHKGAAMSMLNLGAGASVWVGPAIVGLLLDRLGVGGVMWTFAILYVISAALTLTLTLPEESRRGGAAPD